MKRLFTASLLILALPLLMPGAQGAEALEVGASMPKMDVEMKNVDGGMLTLEEIRGEKGTLVIFSCRHCPFVQKWQQRMVEIGNTYRKKDVGVVFINSNDPERFPEDRFESMQEQAEENGYHFPYVMDLTSAVAKAFGARRTPEAFLFNKDDELVYHGAIDDNLNHPDKVKKPFLRDALDALLKGETPPRQKTPSIGCSIKLR
ncbi:thioredoxin family protein [Kiritimatiella glycovorans]|uniref:Alkyl hydroperoxide reductase n=1 Tax=Kiritimatiella glycovorans TaxID=1307763 RepID=A0A0G3EDZ0_9BACT|nr:thioredoxin family protein [Kiritimatiella glycovorans]AKJ64676.1 Alkyl hydroperoxide reductase [Kiritimatiella glycovorans]